MTLAQPGRCNYVANKFDKSRTIEKNLQLRICEKRLQMVANLVLFPAILCIFCINLKYKNYNIFYSFVVNKPLKCPGGGIGRHYGLKIHCS